MYTHACNACMQDVVVIAIRDRDYINIMHAYPCFEVLAIAVY